MTDFGSRFWNFPNTIEPESIQSVQYIYTTVTVFYVLVFVIGVLGNILVTVVVAKNVDMRTPTNYFLVNLSIADLLVLCVCMPSALIEFHARDVWYLGAAMCKYKVKCFKYFLCLYLHVFGDSLWA